MENNIIGWETWRSWKWNNYSSFGPYARARKRREESQSKTNKHLDWCQGGVGIQADNGTWTCTICGEKNMTLDELRKQ